jgi:hypothetical protein
VGVPVNESYLMTVLTVREICEWWGLSSSTVHDNMLREMSRGSDLVRRSGKTILIDIRLALHLYGAPTGDRPQYE